MKCKLWLPIFSAITALLALVLVTGAAEAQDGKVGEAVRTKVWEARAVYDGSSWNGVDFTESVTFTVPATGSMFISITDIEQPAGTDSSDGFRVDFGNGEILDRNRSSEEVHGGAWGVTREVTGGQLITVTSYVTASAEFGLGVVTNGESLWVGALWVSSQTPPNVPPEPTFDSNWSCPTNYAAGELSLSIQADDEVVRATALRVWAQLEPVGQPIDELAEITESSLITGTGEHRLHIDPVEGQHRWFYSIEVDGETVVSNTPNGELCGEVVEHDLPTIVPGWSCPSEISSGGPSIRIDTTDSITREVTFSVWSLLDPPNQDGASSYPQDTKSFQINGEGGAWLKAGPVIGQHKWFYTTQLDGVLLSQSPAGGTLCGATNIPGVDEPGGPPSIVEIFLPLIHR